MSTTTTPEWMTFTHLNVRVPESTYRDHTGVLNAAYGLDTAIAHTLSELGERMDYLRRDLHDASVRVTVSRTSGANTGTVNGLGVVQGAGGLIDSLCGRLTAYLSQVANLRTLVLQVPGATNLH